jgi:hypothetical protein
LRLGSGRSLGLEGRDGVVSGEVPTRLAAALQHGDDVRIRLLPSGQERRILSSQMPVDDRECVEVLLLGEGMDPSRE